MAEKRVALVREDGTVFTVSVWDPDTDPDWTPPAGLTAVECAEEETVAPGMRHAVGAGFLPPDAPRARRVPLRDFLARFTREELVAAHKAAKDDSDLAVAKDMVMTQATVDLDGLRVVMLLDLMVQDAALTAERAGEIRA